MIAAVLHCVTFVAPITVVESTQLEVCEMAKIATFAAVRSFAQIGLGYKVARLIWWI